MPRTKAYYELQLAKLKENYDCNTKTITIRVPKKAHNEWQKRKYKDRGIYLSDLIGLAITFALYGPHPFDNPIDGLEDALEAYVEEGRGDRAIMAKALREIGRLYKIDVKTDV